MDEIDSKWLPGTSTFRFHRLSKDQCRTGLSDRVFDGLEEAYDAQVTLYGVRYSHQGSQISPRCKAIAAPLCYAPSTPEESLHVQKLVTITRGYYQAVFEKVYWNRPITFAPDEISSKTNPLCEHSHPKLNILCLFYQNMSDGNSFLASSAFQSAFNCFDIAFNLLTPILRSDYLQFLTYLCDIMSSLQGAEWEQLINKVFHHLLDLSRVLLPINHPFTSFADLILAHPHNRALASQHLLKSILSLLRTRLGPNHPDTIGVLQTLAYNHLNSDQITEAADCFQELLTRQTALNGLGSFQACQALRGLAETSICSRDFSTTEHHLQSLISRSGQLPLRQQLGMKYRYLRLQSQLQQLTGQLSEVDTTLSSVVDLAVDGFGDGSIQALRARLDRKAWETFREVSVCGKMRTRCYDEYNFSELVPDVDISRSEKEFLVSGGELKSLRHFSCPEGDPRPDTWHFPELGLEK